MKKIAITIALTAVVGSSFGQGYVSVQGTQQSQINDTMITSAWAGGLAPGGTVLGATTSGQSYNVALLTSTAANPILNLFGSGNALASNWLDTGLMGHNNTFAGRLVIGAGLQAANAPVGSSQDWLLVAWSASLGSSWSEVSASLASGNFNNALGYIGWSTVGVGSAAAAAPTQPFVITGTGGVIPGGFSLLATPVPEPGTMALAALSGASLLLFRRRK